MFVTKMPPKNFTISPEGGQIPDADAMLDQAWVGRSMLGASIPGKASVAQDAFFASGRWVDSIDKHPTALDGLGRGSVMNVIGEKRRRRTQDEREQSAARRDRQREIFKSLSPQQRREIRIRRRRDTIRTQVIPNAPSGLSGFGDLGIDTNEVTKREAISLTGEVWGAFRIASNSWLKLIESARANIAGWGGTDAEMFSQIRARAESPVVSWSNALLVQAKETLGIYGAVINEVQKFLQSFGPKVDAIVPEEISKIGKEYDEVVKQRNALSTALRIAPFASSVAVFSGTFWTRLKALGAGVIRITDAAARGIDTALNTPWTLIFVAAGAAIFFMGRSGR
jgi:hypothetical protein